MWQRILDRIAPVVDDELSTLDRRDGVGSGRRERRRRPVSESSSTGRP